MLLNSGWSCATDWRRVWCLSRFVSDLMLCQLTPTRDHHRGDRPRRCVERETLGENSATYIAWQLMIEFRNVEEKRSRIDGDGQTDRGVQIEIAGDGLRHVLVILQDHRLFFQRANLGNVILTLFIITWIPNDGWKSMCIRKVPRERERGRNAWLLSGDKSNAHRFPIEKIRINLSSSTQSSRKQNLFDPSAWRTSMLFLHQNKRMSRFAVNHDLDQDEIAGCLTEKCMTEIRLWTHVDDEHSFIRISISIFNC